MTQVVGSIPFDGGILQIQKNEQNPFNGLVWGAFGATFTAGTLALTAGSIAMATMTTLAAVGQQVKDVPFPLNSLNLIPLPLAATLSIGGLCLSAIALRITGGCFSKSIDHLGPEYKVVVKNL